MGSNKTPVPLPPFPRAALNLERDLQLGQAEDVHEVVFEGSKAMGRAVPPGGANALRHGNRWTTTGDMLGGSTV